MTICWCVFLCTLLLCSSLEVSARKENKGRSNRGHRGRHPSGGPNHTYPPSLTRSGNNPSRPTVRNTHISVHQTNVYNSHGGAPKSPSMYHDSPPTYKDSGSKYGPLLMGLELLNLEKSAGVGHNSGSRYKAAHDEICKFGIQKDNGDYEETRIKCQLITSFNLPGQPAKAHNGGTNTTVEPTSVMNVTKVNGSRVPGNIVNPMLPNGTLVPLNGTLVNGTFVQGAVNVTSPEAPTNGMTSSVSTTTTNTTTVVNALDVKGKPVDVTPGMKCYVLRHTRSKNTKRSVDCGLLQSYATRSLKKNSAARNLPVFTAVAFVAAITLAY